MPAENFGLLDGRYRLGDLLGSGAMATVHAARDEVLDRDVAVKLFRPNATDPLHADRQLSEIRVLARLSHPNLVTLFDAVPPSATRTGAYLVMERVGGPSLAEVLGEGPLPDRHVAILGADVAHGLAAAHEAGVIHRDVKPANILLARGGRAKLADFGIASLMGTAGVTAVGEVIGTPAYLSPEQVRSQQITGSSDVYSLGLVLIECLTGVRCYEGSGIDAALARLAARPVVPTRFPAGWAPLLAAMTANNPADRPTAAAVAERLTRLSALVPLPPDDGPATQPLTLVMPVVPGGPGASTEASTDVLIPVTDVEPMPPARRRRLPLVAGLAGAGVVLTAGAILLAGVSATGSTPRPTTSPAAPAAAASSTAASAGTGTVQSPSPTIPSSTAAGPVAPVAPAPALKPGKGNGLDKGHG